MPGAGAAVRPPRHLLNRELSVWRRTLTSDGAGGRTATWGEVATVRARVSQPSAAERTVAAQAGAVHTHAIYVLPDAGVARGDELRGDGQVFEVHAVFEPSADVYRRCDCQEIQPEAEVL